MPDDVKSHTLLAKTFLILVCDTKILHISGKCVVRQGWFDIKEQLKKIGQERQHIKGQLDVRLQSKRSYLLMLDPTALDSHS